jgi:beta-lactamase regulating signal transducer with metallopeptidase domain/HEAT repeat protein
MLSNVSMVMLLAKATLILLAALGITIVMQRASAGARHLVWLVTLGTLLVVPALAAWSPLRLEILPPVAQQEVSPAPVTPVAVDNSQSSAPAPVTNTSAAASYTTSSETSLLDSIASLRGLSLVLAIWAGVVLLLGVWLAWSALAVRRIVRRAHPLDTQDWLTPLWEIADRLELDEPPRLLGSSDAKMPFACGFIKPTIVLPAECESWTLDRRRAVLLHELAHVKRHDLLGHTLGRLTCAVYWFHPLVWTAAKQLRSESERACDDLALSCGAKPSDYAEHLLDIVTSVKGDATPAVALAMARRKEFEGRMLAILDPDLRHSTPNRRQAAGLIVSLALISVVVGAAAPAPRASAVVVASSLPTTTETPQIRSDFVPQDEAESVEDHAEDPSPEPVPAPEAREKAAGKVEEKTVESSVNAIASTIAEASIEAAARALGGTKISELIEGANGRVIDMGKVRADERPALLANILRTDKDASLRRIAAWGLSDHAHVPVAVEALAYALRQDSEVSVREMAAWALGDARQNSAAIPALMASLKSDSDANVRAISAWALGQIGDRDAVSALTAAINDQGKGVRVRAIWAIGSIEPREAPPAVVALLRDPEPKTRQLATWVIFQTEDPSAAPALQAALERETNDALKLNYIQALAAMGERSVDAVRPLLTSSDPKIRSMAVRALAGGRGAGPWPWPWPEPRPHP